MNDFVLDKEVTDIINPYRIGLGFIWYRIIWDLHPYSWISRRRIMAWKDRFPGQKTIILCNGPTLNSVDFGELDKDGIFCFGVNKINMLFSQTEFSPSVIVAINPYVIQQNADFYNSTDIPLFLNCTARKWIAFRDNVHFIHTAGIHRQFAKDCSISVNEGFTVTYVAMQLAFYMGFKEVALVGCDHSFAGNGPPNETVISGKQDLNHFAPDYFAYGEKWQLPDLIGCELHYDTARRVFEKHGRRIVNCTKGGSLKIFERQTLSKFLRS